MKSRWPPRAPEGVSRMLGYGGSLALVAAAGVVLAMPLLGGDDGSAGQPRARARPTQDPAAQQVPTGDPVPVPSSSPGGREPEPQAPPQPQGGTDIGAEPCPARTAGYKMSGGSLNVTLNVPGRGYAAATVDVKGRQTAVQSTTLQGRPYTFRFTGLPADRIKRISVTTVTGDGMEACDVRATA